MSAKTDKMSIVIKNYFKVECDIDTTIRQAYERGFRRGASSCDALNIHIRKLSDECGKLNEENAKLYEDNAKLRELVCDMWRFTGTACKKYPRLFDPSTQGGQMVQLNMIDAFEQRMDELGVEV